MPVVCDGPAVTALAERLLRYCCASAGCRRSASLPGWSASAAPSPKSTSTQVTSPLKADAQGAADCTGIVGVW